MEDHTATTTGEAGSQGVSLTAQGVERVVSILDFDESGVVTCLMTKPLANSLGRILDSRSTRSVTMDEWSALSRDALL